MLVIRQQQMEVFRNDMLKSFETEMVEHCREIFPQLSKVIGNTNLHVAIRRAIDRARGYNITNRGPLRSYIDTVFLFGSDFDTDPQYPWAGEILNSDEYSSQMQRAEQLYQKTLDYLDTVNGPKGVFSLRAFKRISLLAKKTEPVDESAFISYMLQQMSSVWPEKHAYVGQKAETMLIDKAIRSAEDCSLKDVSEKALFVVLMFTFGHGCLDDPLCPWIANTLKNEKIIGPSARARRLRKKALTYLDCAIDWYEEGV